MLTRVRGFSSRVDRRARWCVILSDLGTQRGKGVVGEPLARIRPADGPAQIDALPIFPGHVRRCAMAPASSKDAPAATRRILLPILSPKRRFGSYFRDSRSHFISANMTLRTTAQAGLRSGLAAMVAVAATITTATAQTEAFLELNDLVAIQFESSPTIDDWTLSTTTPGFTADGYFRWDGPNLFFSPGAEGIFGFDFELETAGEWFLAIHNRHDDPDPTEENDVWVRMDGGTWIKVFSNMPGSVGAWTWESRFDIGSQPDASYPLAVGAHRIEFSGRSNGFKMDRFHLHLAGAAGANDTSVAESPRRFGEAYCSANNNSTGQPSVMSAIGSPFLMDNDVTLHTDSLPNSVLGYYIVSVNEGFLANAGGGSGNLCVGASTGRYAGNILSSGGSGSVELLIDVTSLPQPTGAVPILPGETWRFQFWHRDTSGGGSTSNFSDGLRVTLK
ncbi:MAG: PAS domain-containing protein [Planctomycetota bacterium]